MNTVIPPIKSQGIKTKLVPWINDLIYRSGISLAGGWVEPFFGTGVVGFNSPMKGRRVVGDSNPHIIRFYQGIQDGRITKESMRNYLEKEGGLLQMSEENGYSHFRLVRDRFNAEHGEHDFIFLSRTGFNGLMRFNRKGEWNVPFCKKPNRFSRSYISKICNQVECTARVIRGQDWEFCNRSFLETIAMARPGDLIYCDPPYLGRYVDYYNGWTEEDERSLFDALSKTKARFILSTWHHNEFRANDMIGKYWERFHVLTKSHFYHTGARIENRHAMVEALVFNFDLLGQSKPNDFCPVELLHAVG